MVAIAGTIEDNCKDVQSHTPRHRDEVVRNLSEGERSLEIIFSCITKTAYISPYHKMDNKWGDCQIALEMAKPQHLVAVKPGAGALMLGAILSSIIWWSE